MLDNGSGTGGTDPTIVPAVTAIRIIKVGIDSDTFYGR